MSQSDPPSFETPTSETPAPQAATSSVPTSSPGTEAAPPASADTPSELKAASADTPLTPAAFDRLDLLLAVTQHTLFWIGWGLLLALVIVGLQSRVFVYEIYDRHNMFLPSAELAFKRHWYFTYPAVAALLGCFYFRLRRMAEWREAGRRPTTPLWGKIYLGLAVTAVLILAVPAFVEQLLIARPSLLGMGREKLPRNGLYLLTDLSENGANRLHDYAVPEVGFRFKPNLHLTYLTRGDCIDEKGVSPLLAGRVPFREVTLRVDEYGFPGFADKPTATADVIVVGDSFTHDTLPLRVCLPYLLGQRTGQSVYNMGVGGSGPPQQARYLKHFGPKLAPKTVVWLFFEGNDLLDAEVWDRNYEKAAAAGIRFDEHRYLHEVDSRGKVLHRRWHASTFFAMCRFGLTGFAGGWPKIEAPAAAKAPVQLPPDPTEWSADPWEDDDPNARYLPENYLSDPPSSYDRVTLLPNKRWPEIPLVRGPQDAERISPLRIRVAKKELEFSLYYLQLAQPKEDIRKYRGFAASVTALREMREYCRANKVRLLVAYAPSKCHVYWPWMRQHLLGKRIPGFLGQVDAYAVDRHLTVVRDVMAETAASEGVEFLDLTPALRAEAANGRYVYWPHDTHWSPLGHEVAARVIAERLAQPTNANRGSLPPADVTLTATSPFGTRASPARPPR